MQIKRNRPKMGVPKSTILNTPQSTNQSLPSNKLIGQKTIHEPFIDQSQSINLHKQQKEMRQTLKLSPVQQLSPFNLDSTFRQKTHIQKTEGSASEPLLKINMKNLDIPKDRLLFATETKHISKSLVDLDDQFDYIKTFRAMPMQTIKEIYDTDRKEIERLCSAEKHIPIDSRLAPIRPQLQYPNIPEFRKYFKENERYQEMQQFYQIDPNIYQKMTEKIKQEKLMPREMKLFTNNNNDKLIANNLLGSDMYVDLFSEGLSSSHFSNLKSLQMKNNKLNNNRITMIAKNLPSSIIDLDFSNNAIGNGGIASICDFLNSRNCYLQILNLEDNKLRDGSIMTILKTLQQSKTIKVIKFSKNYITDISMDQFGNLLKTSNSLQEVYLHYNQIRNQGGTVFFRALLKNQYMKVLDFSFNKLGQQKECVQMISEVLGKPHSELSHLDLSYNNFNNDDSKIFHQAIMFNQIIYGFHFEGNGDYSTNARGFLVNQKELDQEYSALVSKQSIRLSTQQFVDQSINRIDLKNKINKLDQHFQLADPSLFKRIQSTDYTNNKSKDNCWLCEGWTEIRFQYVVGKSGTISDYPIYLHLDFENYRPMIMEQDQQIFFLLRMCPPNRKIRYFFSNPFLDIQFTAKDQRITALDDFEPIKVQGIPMIYADTSVVYSQKISIVNYLSATINKKVLDSQKHYVPTVLSRPREQEKIVYIDPNKAKEKSWSIENSIFRDFQADTEGHLLDCFDFDFECGRLQKHIPDPEDLEVLKTKVKVFYKNILACYKYYCAETLNYDTPCINQQSFIDFISQTNILSKSILNNIDLQLTYLSSYVVQKSAEFIHVLDKCLVRYQFLEIIIRLAKEQYLRTNQCNNITDALDMLFKQDKVLDLIQEFGVPQDWRDTRYWTQLMDSTIKMKIQFLQLMYDYVSKITFKHNKYVTLTDFKLFIEQLDLGKYVSEKELYLIYLQSMQTQRDELRESNHIQMQFLEFVEAIARLAEKISPISPMYAVRNPAVNKITRKSLPLFVKFEGLLYIIFQKIKQGITTKTNEQQIQDLEKNVLSKTILKTVQAKKLGVFEEDRSSDEEREKESRNVPLLPDEKDQQEIKEKKVAGSGWSKLRNWANKKKLQKQGNPEQINMLKQLQTYQDEEERYVQVEYEQASIYEKMEIKQRQRMKQEFQRTKLNQDPTFKFEEEDEIKRF
ncbi:unnamed protein product [Paramecium pentaurelia]|uniref:Leucine Rich Repeat family protein n=1 Tax=Paramecium pentaurelia TaxID=43138 RepID=A0A8S1TCN1_9CILI|nr:unnamed protein product [Paramecium pentaurelia]